MNGRLRSNKGSRALVNNVQKLVAWKTKLELRLLTYRGEKRESFNWKKNSSPRFKKWLNN